MKKILKFFFFKMKCRGKNVRYNFSSNIGFGSFLEGNNRIGKNTMFNGVLGRCSYIGENSIIDGKVGRYCSIASEVKTVHGKHPTSFASTSPVFYSNSARQTGMTYVSKTIVDEHVFADNKEHTIVIGNDVWIGYRATILAGITIGDGAIIGAGALVTRDIPPYAIAVGVPAKVIRYRFSEEDVQFFLDFKWWNQSEQWIKDHAELFSEPERLIELIKCESLNKNSILQ